MPALQQLLLHCACLCLFTTAGVGGSSSDLQTVDTFQVNINHEPHSIDDNEYIPPHGGKLSYEHVLGRCFGCGVQSYTRDKVVCVQRTSVIVKIGNSERSMTAVFKVPESRCRASRVKKPPLIRPTDCGPPCDSIRLLTQKALGCRCNHNTRTAYDAPALVCQDHTNRTVDLALCETLYYNNTAAYAVSDCDYESVCRQPTYWVEAAWEKCSEDNGVSQSREVVCVANTGVAHRLVVMHPSECRHTKQPAAVRYCARWVVSWPRQCKCSTGMGVRVVRCWRYSGGQYQYEDEKECRSWHKKPAREVECSPQQLRALNCSGY